MQGLKLATAPGVAIERQETSRFTASQAAVRGARRDDLLAFSVLHTPDLTRRGRRDGVRRSSSLGGTRGNYTVLLTKR